jgi:small subunit ribosomal protein S1
MEQNDALNGQGGTSESNPQTEATNNSMETLLENEGLGLDFPQQGEVRSGMIASISPSQILVSIGAKSEGVIAGRELEQIPAEEREAFQVGQEIPVYVLNPEDSYGNVIVSYLRAQEQMGWDAVEEMLGNDNIYEGAIDGYNKGGLIVPIHGLRGFVPASQVSAVRRGMAAGDTPDQRWGKMVGEPIMVRVIEVDRERRRLILSERAAGGDSRQSLKERVIEELTEGEVRTGRVTSLADFGAFVNINGADGLVHLSEISWERVQHPSEVLEVGQEVKVKVINIDREKKRIGLSIRQLSDDPWRSRVEQFQVGQLVEGVVTRLAKFGAFARLEGDIEGLIHISEISEQRIEHPREALHEGDVLTLRVIRIDPDQRRIGLSLRKVDSPAYADKDMKILAAELSLAADETPEAPAAEEAPPTPPDEPPAAEEQPDTPAEEPAETSEPPAPAEEPAETSEPPAPAEEPQDTTQPPAPAEEPQDTSEPAAPEKPQAE